MYQMKPKKTSYILLIISGLLSLCAIGMGIGYAGVRVFQNKSADDFEKNIIADTEPENAPAEIEEVREVLKTEKDIFITPQPQEESYLYLIKLENGKTKVYTLSGNAVVYSHELPVEPGALPPDDINILKEGIYLKNKDELLSFTEDFCS